MKLIQILIFLSFFKAFLFGQTDFRTGYIIDSSGDTIFGQVDYRGDLLMGMQCRFMKEGQKEVQLFKPFEIQSYRFTDGKYYISRKISNQDVFLEYVLNGQVNIYYLRDQSGDHYYIEKDTLGLTELPYSERVEALADGYGKHPQYLVKSKQHIGLLKLYMYDAPELNSSIEALGAPVHRNLVSIGKKYHNLVCKDHECIVYERKEPAVKVALGPAWNYRFPRNEFGLDAYFWLPRSSEKLYLKTGAFYLHTEEGRQTVNVFRFPFQLQYMYTAKSIMPAISVGINVYSYELSNYNYTIEKRLFHTTALNAGLNIRITRKLRASVLISTEYTPLSACIMSGNMDKFGLVGISTGCSLLYEF
jgi:hypothetical protein